LDVHQLLLPLLALLAVGGGIYAIAYPLLVGDSQAEKRKAALQSRTPAQLAGRVNDAAKRRKAVAESLKELDARTRSKKLSLETKLLQGGIAWSRQKYYIASAVAALLAASVALILSQNLFVAGGALFVGGFGLPSWVVSFRRKRRLKKFLDEFPSAVDIIVRGIKAGIPLGDCLRNIASEAAEPVKTEFRMIIEAQQMGLSIPEAVDRIIERVPLAESNFFSIVISIQAKAGGNLAEALGNLSVVLRDRKKMKAKIKAMSAEAKASAGIIGSLPPIVALLIYVTSPSYMSLLFYTSTGHMVLAGCAVWMSCGIFIMKKMINFDM
jgi:tight adherence protein B